jgi:hypothetical protein
MWAQFSPYWERTHDTTKSITIHTYIHTYMVRAGVICLRKLKNHPSEMKRFLKISVPVAGGLRSVCRPTAALSSLTFNMTNRVQLTPAEKKEYRRKLNAKHCAARKKNPPKCVPLTAAEKKELTTNSQYGAGCH